MSDRRIFIPGIARFGIALLTFLTVTLRGSSATYFVATNGSDAAAGTVGAPFRTLAKGVTVLTAGDTLFVRGGTYRETLTPASSGTAASPITISAFPNEAVTISGADIVTGWTQYSNNIYRATTTLDLGEGRNQVFVDGEMMQQARFPNFGSGDLLHPNTSAATVDTANINHISSTDWGGKPANYWAGARFLGGMGSSWSWQTAVVLTSSGNDIYVDSSMTSGVQWFTGAGPCYLWGLLQFLDADREWHLDAAADKLYLQIDGGGNPNLHAVELKSRLWTVNISGVNYITLNGLQLRAGAVQLNGTGLVMNNCDVRFPSHFLAFVDGATTAGPNLWDRGVVISGVNSKLQGCSIHDAAGSGVYCVGSSNTVTRCSIYNVGYTGISGPGIFLNGFYHSIMFNTISNIGWAGISPARNSSGHSIFYNDIAKISEINRDTGCFYAASGSNAFHTRIAYNWCHDVVPPRLSGKGLYFDNWSENYVVDHNVLWNILGSPPFVFNGPRSGHKIYNNTVFNGGTTDLEPAWEPIGTGGPADPATFLNTNSLYAYISNHLYLAYAPQSQLVNWAAHDFRPQPGAPAVDAGVVIPGTTDGYRGSAPDLGAYESGGPYWVPGVNGWAIDQPGIVSGPPSNWSGASATVQGTLVSAGTSSTTVRVYWGSTDGGTNIAAWQNVVTVGSYSTNPVPLIASLSPLTPGADYTYRFFAMNANGVSWGAAYSFTATGGIWAADTSGDWSDTAPWQNGVVADGANSLADFSNVALTADRTVTVDAPRTVGALRFGDNSNGHDWNLAGLNALTLSLPDGPYIEVLNQTATIAAPLAGSGSLAKRGDGLLVLAGGDTNTGPTSVDAGGLLVNSSLSSSSLSVAPDAILGGNGAIAAPVTVETGGALSPGAQGLGAAGTLTTSNLTLNLGAKLLLDVASATNAGANVNDLIYLMPGSVLTLVGSSGAVTGSISLVLNPLNGYVTNRTYLIISNAAAIVGNVPALFTAPGYAATFSTNAGSGPYNVYMTLGSPAGEGLVWQGTNGTAWNVGSSVNWSNSLLQTADVFNQSDLVTFDDTAANFNVALLGTLSPTSVTVNNRSNNYTFLGSGKLSGSASLTKLGSGTLTVSTAAGNYTGPTAVLSGTLAVTSANALGTSTLLSIGSGDPNLPTTGSLDLSSASQTVGGLTTAAFNPAGLNNLEALLSNSVAIIDLSGMTNSIKIGSGQTLTVNGTVVAGNTINTTASIDSFTTMSGGGSFIVNNSGGSFRVNGNDSTATPGATETHLDLSGLSSASLNLGSSGTLYVGDLSSAGLTANGSASSYFTLATNTTITANNLNMGNSSRQPAVQFLRLGAGSNIFNVNQIQLQVSRDAGQIHFNTDSGSFMLRAADGVGRSIISLAGNNQGTAFGSPHANVLDLGNHWADLKLSSLKIGVNSVGCSGFPYNSNYFNFANGVLDTTTFNLGIRTANNSLATNWYNVVNLGNNASTNCTVIIGSGGLVLGTGMGINGPGATNSTLLTIGGGSVTVNNDVAMLNQKATAGNNPDVSIINLTGGTFTIGGNLYATYVANPAVHTASFTLNGDNAVLDLTGHAIGGLDNSASNPTNYIDVLIFQAGTLQNVGQINGGANVVKTGPATLTLAGTNTYTGATLVNEGTLAIFNTPQPTGAFSIGDGATLAMAVNNSGATASLSGLTLGTSGSTTLRFNFAVTPSAGIAPLTVANLAVNGGNSAVSVGVSGNLALGQFPLIRYSGNISGAGFAGFTLNSLPAGVSASLVNNSANHSIDLNVSSLQPVLLSWDGLAGAAWDIDTSVNWLNGATPQMYQQGNSVRFDDSASGTTALTLDVGVTPAGITFSNDTKNYFVTGSGSVGGPGGVTKQGSGSATLDVAGSYVGPTTVTAGALIISALQQGGGVYTVSDGAELGINAYSFGSMPMASLTLGAAGHTTLQINFAGNPTTTVPCVWATNLIANGGVNAVTLNFGGSRPPVGQFPIIKYNGTIGGSGYTAFHLGTLPPGLTATLVNNTGNHSIDLSVTAVTQVNLTWSGAVGNAWDANVTTNWLAGAMPQIYLDQDSVLFDDTATGTTSVALDVTVSPASLTVSNNTKNYTLSGMGALTGNTGLIKQGSGTLTLSNAGPNLYTGPTLIKKGTVVLQADNEFSTNTTLMLGDSGSAGSLNLSSASQTVGALTNLSLTPATNLIIIGSGQTLTVNGPLISGYNAVSSSASSNVVAMAGAGSLVVANSGLLRVGANDSGTTSSTFDRTILDLSALANANINLGSTGKIYVGDFAAAGAAAGPGNSTFLLASNTTLTAGFLSIGNSSRQIVHNLVLGSGSNVFNITTNQLGLTRDAGQIYFNSSSGSLRMRAADGISRANLIIAPSSGTTFSATNQFVELGNHYADLRLNVLKVGEDNRGSSGSPYSSNYFGFANGLLDTTELRIGNRPGNPASTPALWYNVCNLGGGTVMVGASGITMSTSRGNNGAASTNSAVLNISGGAVTVSNDIVVLTQLATSGNNVAIGTVNITGGTNIVYGNILCGSAAGNPAAHVATLTLNGPFAVLDLTGHTIGGTSLNPANYLDVLNFQAGTLQNVAGINGGASLVKTGPGTLTLAGANTYSGNTLVNAGTLLVTGTVGTNSLAVITGTLGGSGIIRGPVTVGSTSTLAPGVNGLAALTISNSLLLQGTSVFEIARNGSVRTNDLVTGLSTVTCGGQIIVTNVGNSPLLVGDSFKLFNASVYAGTFANVVLPAGYTWNNRLAIDGTITVLSAPVVSSPTFFAPTMSGSDLVLQGTNGTANGTYYLLSTTNAALPLANWTVVSTNAFDTAGAFSNVVPLNPFAPEKFFLIKQ